MFGLKYSKSEYLSNKFCLILVQISKFLLIFIAFIFLIPFIIIMSLYQRVLDYFRIKDIPKYISSIASILIYLCFYIIITLFSTCFAITMLIYWPLQGKYMKFFRRI